MAPEQVRGEALDARADLFALAAMVFEMLSGKVAFDGATMVDVLHAVLHEQPPALSGGGTVAGLDRVIHKGLQSRPPIATTRRSQWPPLFARRSRIAIRGSSRRWRRGR